MVRQFEQRRLRIDGAEIGYQRAGSGRTLVLANGLGGSYVAWKPLLPFVQDWWTVSWDYRGLYRSTAAETSKPATMDTHIGDLWEILAAEGRGDDPIVVIGWSMGVQLGFEILRRHKSRVAGLVCINGVAGRPFDTAFGSGLLRRAIPLALMMGKRQTSLTRAIIQRSISWRGLIPWMQRLGLAAPTLDIEVFEELSREFADIDFAQYARMFELLGAHDARDLLSSVQVPTLIIAGDRDVLTPVSTAEQLARAIPHARLRVITGGTHYTPVEYPEIVGNEVAKFLADLKT